METQARYDLNAAIENWRAELAVQPNLTAEVRRELETHLRDAIAGFQQRGLNDEESFWLACKRVGQPSQLGEEFVKANPVAVWRERVFWMWLAVFLSSTLGTIASSVAFALTPFPGNSLPDNTLRSVIQVTLYLLPALIPILVAVLLAKGKCVVLFSKLVNLLENRLRMAIAVYTCVALSSSIKMTAYAVFNARGNGHASALLWPSLISIAYALISAALLVWLMPPQNPKTSKRA